MSTVTLVATAFADMCRVYDVVLMPVAVGGYLYAVKRGSDDSNIYRVAIA